MERKQENLFTILKERGNTLIVAGDGRCDSPGHSAKFGSCTLLELTLNKIVDFKIVQVLNLLSLVFWCVLQSVFSPLQVLAK